MCAYIYFINIKEIDQKLSDVQIPDFFCGLSYFLSFLQWASTEELFKLYPLLWLAAFFTPRAFDRSGLGWWGDCGRVWAGDGGDGLCVCIYPSGGGVQPELPRGQTGDGGHQWEVFLSPQGCCNGWGGAGEKQLDTWYIFKMEPSGLASGLELMWERNASWVTPTFSASAIGCRGAPFIDMGNLGADYVMLTTSLWNSCC